MCVPAQPPKQVCWLVGHTCEEYKGLKRQSVRCAMAELRSRKKQLLASPVAAAKTVAEVAEA